MGGGGVAPKSPKKNMVWVPDGDFLMGSADHYPEERPVHRRTVRGFWADHHPVTNAEFRRFVNDTGHVTTAEIAPTAEDYPDASDDQLVPGSLVFTPNGMRNTTYTRQAWLDGRIALPHDAQGSALAPPLCDAAVASDDVYSTPSDYAQFLIGAMNGRGLSPALREERAAVFADRRADLCRKLTPEHCPAEAGMGLGWESFLIDGQRYLMHTGADDGTFTFAYFSPDTRTGLVIFTNSSNGAKTVLPLLRLVGNDGAFIDFLDRLVGAPQGGE